MKLTEALNIIHGATHRKGGTFKSFLATGLNPLHLKTFIAAELSLLFTDRKIEIQTGLYGDFLGNLRRLSKAEVDAGIVVMEWADLDPRLGIRTTAGWTPSICTDILSTAQTRAADIQEAITEAAAGQPLSLCLPTLPLPPVSHTPGWQAGALDVELRALVASLGSQVSVKSRVRLLNPQRIDAVSPLPDRFDVRSELLTGFPYKLPHAKALASLLSQLVRGPVPQKGLITDLDDTLWRGILGEVGVNGISWHLDQHSHMHGLYQQVLNALSAEGVLVAVVSKNERSLVEEAFRRRDILISSAAIFPFELTWGAKSEAIARVLKTWNVGPDSVVFIDDSPFELAEGKTSHPEMECIQFPTFDGPAIYELLERLRDRFGRSAILEEDAIRLDSIRRTHVAAAEGDLGGEELPRFLAQAEPELTFDFSGLPMDPRALELVNKTNQFNLNARRFTENSFQSYVGNPAAFSSVVSYRDKYGPLGKIAVLMGRKNGRKLRIDTWVMSCRAFSRHIEYQCLKELFDRFDVDEIEFDYLPTERNTPLGEFLGKILGVPPRPGPCLFRKEFLEKFPETFHSVQEVAHE